MRQRLIPVLIGVCALAAAAGLRVLDPEPVRKLRVFAFDSYQAIRPRPYEPAGVRIVTIDEASLRRVGQWPWPRTTMAELVTQLRKLGAAAIAFDVVFAEPDRTAPARLLAAWRGQGLGKGVKDALKELPDPDRVFAKALAKAPVVTGFAPRSGADGTQPPRPAGFAVSGTKPGGAVPAFPGATTNLPVIAKAAKGNGSFAVVNDFDSVVRRVPLLQRVDGRLYPSLAAEALRVGQRASTHIVKTSTGSGEMDLSDDTAVAAMRIGRVTVPTTGAGSVILHDTGYVPARYVPAWKVLAAQANPEVARRIRGHIVLVGASAPGLKDIRATPLSPAVPGVSLHAQALEQMIHGDFLHRPDWSPALEIGVLLAVGLGLAATLPFVGAAWCGLAGLFAVTAAAAGSWFAFDAWGWLIDPVYPALGALAVYLPTSAARFVITEGEKRFIRSAFSRYLSPALVAQLTRQPDSLNLGGENRELTVMFTDIRGFTPVAESMTPEELTRFMNRFLTPMTTAILDHAGYVDKYMGDAIMAFWNAPVATPEHPVHAGRAALAMRTALAGLNAQWQHEFAEQGRSFPGVAVGIGLHTGVCSVGNMGSAQRFDYSALGDNVNLASRLEGQSKTYGVDAVVSEAVRRAAGDAFAFLELDRIRVKGRREPVQIHTLAGDAAVRDDPGFQAFRADHDAMLAAYRAQDWDGAEAARARCAEAIAAGPAWQPGGLNLAALYDLYAARIAALRADPPPADWDAVFEAQTK